jgi:DNA-binding MarR family transcriptional regulator
MARVAAELHRHGGPLDVDAGTTQHASCDRSHRRNGCTAAILALVQATDTRVSPRQLAESLADLWRRMTSGGENATFELVAELGLSLTQLKSLFLLNGCAEDLSVGELSERLGISLAAASRTAEGMLKRGWIERREDEQDRRTKRLSLTPSGSDLAQQIADARMQGLEAFAASLTDAQRAHLHAALSELQPKD